jgi:hypothetical protein
MKKPIQQKGVAAVEFAILLPLLLLIVFGITEFGRALYAYNTLVKATRDAARYYAIQQPGNPPDKADEIMNWWFWQHGGTGNALAAGLDEHGHLGGPGEQAANTQVARCGAGGQSGHRHGERLCVRIADHIVFHARRQFQFHLC